ncbi:MAG: flavodoxin [Flavisolibacter sp.]|nr:flavodoxin [Flavisolibacter sp.]
MSLVHFFLFSVMLFTSSCKEDTVPSNKASLKSDEVLIVYLSRTNNTKRVAEIIHSHVGGKLVALELKTPYPEDYQTTVNQVQSENESGFLPPLKTTIDSIEKYKTVFIGFPTWGMRLPPPMKSFLHQYNLSGKTLIPFNTNGGYGIGSSFQTVRDLCPNSTVLEGYSVKGGSERDGILYVMQEGKEVQVQTEVKDWLQRIKVFERLH